MWRHLISLSLPEWRHHPWRHAAALLAVALGVALASSVQMINESALGEFAQAVRSVNGQPDAVLAGASRDGFDDALYARVLLDEGVAGVSPVLEIDSAGRWQDDAPAAAPPTPLRVVGVDALKVATIAPALMPQPSRPAAASRPGRWWPPSGHQCPPRAAAWAALRRGRHPASGPRCRSRAPG